MTRYDYDYSVIYLKSQQGRSLDNINIVI